MVPVLRFKPMILEIRLKCFKNVLQLVQLTSEASIIKLFPAIFSPRVPVVRFSPGDSGEIWTHHLKNFTQILYYCATACPTHIRGLNYKTFSRHFSRLVPAMRFEPTILGIWLKCCTTVLQLVQLTSEASIIKLFRTIFSPLVPAVRFEPTINVVPLCYSLSNSHQRHQL